MAVKVRCMGCSVVMGQAGEYSGSSLSPLGEGVHGVVVLDAGLAGGDERGAGHVLHLQGAVRAEHLHTSGEAATVRECLGAHANRNQLAADRGWMTVASTWF